MSIIAKRSYLLKSILFYRRIRHNAGHGVHSPFVFHLISKVIKETAPYYCFQDIELIRNQLLQKDEIISYTDQQSRLRKRTMAKFVKKEAISPKQGALLFRIAHYVKAKHILQIGLSTGISTLYLTSYSSCLKCIAIENPATDPSIAKWVYEKAARNPVDIRPGTDKKQIKKALEEMKTIDLVFFNTPHDENAPFYFEQCAKHIQDKSVFIIKGIKSNRKMSTFWKTICLHPETTVTIDLFSLGIVFFSKKLHKHNYKVYF